MKIKNIFMITICVGLLFGCAQGVGVDEKPEQIDTASVINGQNEKHDVLILDGTAKWNINEEMRPYVNASQDLLNTYVDKADTAYHQLAAKLQMEIDSLVQSCTMKGESHANLHKWLHPHIELVKELKETNVDSVAQNIVLQLEDSYATFHQYFE